MNTRLIVQKKITRSVLALIVSVALAGLTACSNHNNSSSEGQMQVKLHDAPALFGAVQLDIQKVEVKNSSSTSDTSWVTISNQPQTVNLLDLTNGNTKIIASSNVKSGTYTTLRLVLGSNNKVEVNGTMMNLNLSSNAQAGVDVNINTQVDAQNSATLLLDFDVARSITAGLTGSFTLNPVIAATQESNSGDVSGQIQPANAMTAVYVKSGSDTVSSTYSDTTSGDFKLIGLAQGNYDVNIHSMNSAYSDTTISNVSVAAKQETKLGAVVLPSN
jgi:hypothetical protein